MSIRDSLICFLLAISLQPSAAKNKKRQQLPDVVLNAQRVYVVIHPDASEPLTDPRANRNAQDAVESALSKWHRFELVSNSSIADLIVVVRKGHSAGPVITNVPNDRPVRIQGNGVPGAGVRIGGQNGRSPDLTNPGADPEDRNPHLGSQIGPSEDMFEVYLGGSDYPLDAPPIWRYMAKNALNGPEVAAVEQFRKAVEDSEKQKQSKP